MMSFGGGTLAQISAIDGCLPFCTKAISFSALNIPVLSRKPFPFGSHKSQILNK